MTLATPREKCAHLLRRFGLGASESEMEFYFSDGRYESAVQKLLNYENTDEGFDLGLDDLVPVNKDKKGVPMKAVVSWWGLRLAVTRRPLQEKMTLFWHNHFATSAEKVKAGPAMFEQNELLRAHATGSFHDLLFGVSKDPAMIFWLDNQYNVAGKPNENFAREVMELFTLGIGHYTEKDVQETARAFTGWSIGTRRDSDPSTAKARGTFVVRSSQHDGGPKTIFGQTGPFGGDEVLDMLLAKPETAQFLVAKIWNWFVYPNPGPAVLSRFAARFFKSGYDIKDLLESIMLSPEFGSAQAMRAIYKNPVDFVVPVVRQLGMGAIAFSSPQAALSRRAPLILGDRAALAMQNMGMHLFYPPDVSGWKPGPGWVTTATMLQRMKLADQVFGTGTPDKGRFPGRYPAAGLFAEDPSPGGVAEKLVSVFDAPLPAKKVEALVAAAERSASEPGAGPNQMATAVSRLVFASPEFQFS